MERSNPLFYHALCILVFAVMIGEMFLTLNYALFKTRIKMERMYRDGLNPFVHPTFAKYRTFCLVEVILVAKCVLILLRHVLLPLLGLGSNRLAMGILTLFSDFGILIALLYLYP